MATKTYEETVTGKDGLVRKFVITADETDTSWSFTSVKISVQKGSYSDIFIYFTVGTTTQTTILNVSGTPSQCGFTSDGNYWSRTVTYSLSTTKSKTSVKTYNFNLSAQLENQSVGFAKLVMIPKKTSYAVTYMANGGSGAPSTQTKWYGETLTLSSSKPTRAGYQFIGWNTAEDGTGTTYASGASYTTNAALTLYAQWQSAAKPPTISLMSVIRSDSSGTQDDNGTYCKVTVRWSVDTTSAGMSANTGTVSGKYHKDASSYSTYSISFSGDRTGTGGTATALISGMSLDSQYIFEVTVKNSKVGTGQSGALSTTRGEILTKAKFVLDFGEGGNSMGIGVAAPTEGLEVGWDAQFDEDVNIAKTLNVTGNSTFGGTLGVTGNLSADNYKLTSTTVLANIVTLESGWTASGAFAYKFGRLCQVYLRLTTTVARTAGASVTVGTLATAWRPITYFTFGCGNGGGAVSSGGSISLVPARAMNANTLLIVAFTYMSYS